jgi:hypothetical protein
MSGFEDDPAFEQLLRAAMRARPEPPIASNLAHRAVERARAQMAEEARAQLGMLSRLRRRNRLVGLAAGVLISLVILVGGQRVWNSSFWTDSSATTISASSDSTSSSTTSTGTITLGVALTVEALIVALILLSSGASDPRPTFA